MADQDVVSDRQPAEPAPDGASFRPSPAGGTGQDTDATNNGHLTGLGAADSIDAGPAARLRADFAPKIRRARSTFSETVAAMDLAIMALRDEGRPPSYRLVQAIGDCRRAFLRLRLDLTRQAGALSLPVPPLDSLQGIEDLDRLINAFSNVGSTTPGAGSPEPERVSPPDLAEARPLPVAPAVADVVAADEPPAVLVVDQGQTIETAPPAPELQEDVAQAEPPSVPEVIDHDHGQGAEAEHPDEAQRRAALDVIDRVERLFVRDGSDLTGLKECQSRALELRERLADCPASELPEEALSLARGDHPLAGLLTVVAGIDALGDAQWAAVHATVTEAFGRQLAVAAARGRLAEAPRP